MTSSVWGVIDLAMWTYLCHTAQLTKSRHPPFTFFCVFVPRTTPYLLLDSSTLDDVSPPQVVPLSLMVGMVSLLPPSCRLLMVLASLSAARIVGLLLLGMRLWLVIPGHQQGSVSRLNLNVVTEVSFPIFEMLCNCKMGWYRWCLIDSLKVMTIGSNITSIQSPPYLLRTEDEAGGCLLQYRPHPPATVWV